MILMVLLGIIPKIFEPIASVLGLSAEYNMAAQAFFDNSIKFLLAFFEKI